MRFDRLATSLAFLLITQYYTAVNYRPVREIAKASRQGEATNIISGIAVGMETTALPALTIGAALLSSYYVGKSVDFETNIGLFNSGGIYGTAVATMGMLMTAAYILAMDCFGPITDNAGGIVEMSNQPQDVRDNTDALDAVGNTTKALTKATRWALPAWPHSCSSPHTWMKCDGSRRRQTLVGPSISLSRKCSSAA